ncbi:hypothetical protein MKX01_002031, partial [Papaver californicum]
KYRPLPRDQRITFTTFSGVKVEKEIKKDKNIARHKFILNELEELHERSGDITYCK